MVFLIFLVTVLFSFSAFLAAASGHGSILLYYVAELQFLFRNIFLFLICFLVLTAYIMRQQHVRKHTSRVKRLIVAVFHSFQITVLGFLLSLVVLIVLAWVQMNVLAFFLNISPRITGVNTDTSYIIKSLGSMSTLPNIVVSDSDKNKELRAIATTETGSTTLYSAYFLSSIPSEFILPLRHQPSSMLLIDNTLIITRIDENDIQAISPSMGYLFVKGYFPDRDIKTSPKIAFMNATQYQDSRKNDAIIQLAQIDEDISKIESALSSASAKLTSDSGSAAHNQNQIDQTAVQARKAYQTCMNTGTYSSGTFKHTYTQDQCNSLASQVNSSSQTSADSVANTEVNIQADQNLIAQYQYYDSFFKTQRALVEKSSANIPHELGVFNPPNTIRVEFATSSSHALADYFETLTHEYLHYASYQPDKKLTDSFFEEGLTEYFARQAIQESLGVSTNLGYPVQVKIIQEMTKLIPEGELADVYFSKDEVGLESLLDHTYGDNFYEDNEITFQSLQYASNTDQMLKAANDIMKKIGGEPLTQKDVFSSYSELK